MIDIESIEKKCKKAIKDGYGHLPVIECGNAVKINELITRLREAEKDAARYRWLRDRAEEQDHYLVTTLESLEWDGFIDEAMQCK